MWWSSRKQDEACKIPNASCFLSVWSVDRASERLAYVNTPRIPVGDYDRVRSGCERKACGVPFRGWRARMALVRVSMTRLSSMSDAGPGVCDKIVFC